MIEGINLISTSKEGEVLRAQFIPEKGMNMVSFKKGDLEVIDQSTKDLFEERYAGLGAMIGPHFHHRNPKIIPPLKNEGLFPFVAKLKSKGIEEPFSHGIGRYAPWKVEQASSSKLRATLEGKDEWEGVKLQDLEGQNFKMNYQAEMTVQGLLIELSCISDSDSVVGLHTYYHLSQGNGKIITKVKDQYNNKSEWLPIPSAWDYKSDHTLMLPLTEDIDFGFLPYPDPLQGYIRLETQTHAIEVNYTSDVEENSFQIWHPKDKTFCCIEPLSAKDPRKPHLSVSRIKILISILPRLK